MIEINLLPGDGKKKRRAKAGTGSTFRFQPAQWFAGITEKITDKYLLGAIGAAVLSGLLIAFMFIHQTAQASGLEERETKAIKTRPNSPQSSMRRRKPKRRAIRCTNRSPSSSRSMTHGISGRT